MWVVRRVDWLRRMLVLLLLVCVALLPAAALAQDDSAPADEDVEAIAAVIDELLAAFVAGDADAVDALTAESFFQVDNMGEIQDRDAWLEVAGLGIFAEMTVSDVTMTALSDDLVLAVGSLDGAGEAEGSFAFFETDSFLFERTDDGWQLAFLQGTDRAAETEAYWAGAMREEMIAALPTLTIEVSEDGIVVPEEVPAGPTLIEMINSAGTTSEDGSPILPEITRLRDDATVDDLLEVLPLANTDPGAILALSQFYGIQIVPGGRMILDLQPGEHAAVTFEETPQAGAFTVTENDTPAELTADVQVELVDFAFSMPDEIPAGPQLWEIANNGSQWHEVVVMELGEGMTIDDVLAMLASESPHAEEVAEGEETAAEGEEAAAEGEEEGSFMPAYGYVSISEGMRAFVEVDLAPGTYAVICLLPDILGDMSPHFAHGMVHTLTVTE